MLDLAGSGAFDATMRANFGVGRAGRADAGGARRRRAMWIGAALEDLAHRPEPSIAGFATILASPIAPPFHSSQGNVELTL